MLLSPIKNVAINSAAAGAASVLFLQGVSGFLSVLPGHGRGQAEMEEDAGPAVRGRPGKVARAGLPLQQGASSTCLHKNRRRTVASLCAITSSFLSVFNCNRLV